MISNTMTVKCHCQLHKRKTYLEYFQTDEESDKDSQILSSVVLSKSD